VSWQLVFTKQAQKDAKKLASAGLREKAEELLTIVSENPFQMPPPYEKLVGDLAGAYSRRINIPTPISLPSPKSREHGKGSQALDSLRMNYREDENGN
jgi:toxin YoeB